MDCLSSPFIDVLVNDSQVPEPFLFNGLKHHKLIAKNLIDALNMKSISSEYALRLLLKTGNCAMDYYYGELSPIQIAEEIKIQLISIGLWGYNELTVHLNSLKGKFLNIDVSDSSIWTIVGGRDSSRYIHFHPARGSGFTIRIRAITLRTAIFMKSNYDDLSLAPLLESINSIRVGILSESPIRDLSNAKQLIRLLSLF